MINALRIVIDSSFIVDSFRLDLIKLFIHSK
jgi:hypothetical protein